MYVHKIIASYVSVFDHVSEELQTWECVIDQKTPVGSPDWTAATWRTLFLSMSHGFQWGCSSPFKTDLLYEENFDPKREKI